MYVVDLNPITLFERVIIRMSKQSFVHEPQDTHSDEKTFLQTQINMLPVAKNLNYTIFKSTRKEMVKI